MCAGYDSSSAPFESADFALQLRVLRFSASQLLFNDGFYLKSCCNIQSLALGLVRACSSLTLCGSMMKKGFRLVACSMRASASYHPPGHGKDMDSLIATDLSAVFAQCSPTMSEDVKSELQPHSISALPSRHSFDYGKGMDSLATNLSTVFDQCSPTTAKSKFQPRSISALPSRRPPGYGKGMDNLVATDLSAVFVQCSPTTSADAKSMFLQPLQKIFPAVSFLQEKACIDDTFKEKKRFMKMFAVNDTSTKGKGTLKVQITEQPNDGSPSEPIFRNPYEGIQVVRDSIFRTGLCKEGTYTVFTSWVACPCFGPERAAICYTSGHSFAEDHYDMHYTTKGSLDFNWQEGVGCSGSIVKVEQLCNGFQIAINPLGIVYNTFEDMACFEAFGLDADFLLPCSLDEVELGGFVSSYGYPCVATFLHEAHEELILQKDDHGIADLYKTLALDPKSLYRLLQDTFAGFTEGQLCCSPGIFTSCDGGVLHIKSSTLQGCSGSPVIPAGMAGYTIGIHEGGTRVDSNIASSTDNFGFVQSYSKNVLPYLPPPDAAIFVGRDLGPFKRWLNKHGLEWCPHENVDVEQGFLTPPPKELRLRF